MKTETERVKENKTEDTVLDNDESEDKEDEQDSTK